jgi:AcrR family transcriptional regulator
METRRTQAARSQATRESIAQAALTVFALKGYAASSMDDICLAAGCSKGGLYHHFTTKGAVLGAVIDRMSSLGALMPPFPPDSGVSFRAMGRVLLEAWAEAAREPDLRDRLRQAYEAQMDTAMREQGGLAALLRVGTLIQMLTRGEEPGEAELARRLGIEHAA